MPDCEICHTPLETSGTRAFCPACLLKTLWEDEDETLLDESDEPATPVAQSHSLPQVPRHQLIEKLGSGGFAVVYRAIQTEPVRREAAVKVLRANVATAQVLARFEAERQTLARMEHPGIARLWDAGRTGDGQPFFAMELVNGLPVTTFCTKHQLNLRERLEIFVAICDAVQHAHEKGVLHRDLKPSNLLIDEARQAKVIDFGIAKALEIQPEESSAITTLLHQTVGTPGYMSPEQAEWGAQHVDARSDIYALGVLLYELITGRTPLAVERNTDAAAARRAVASDIIAPSRLAGSLLQTKTQKRDLDAIALKALEHESNLRYASAAALAEDVLRHLQDKPVEAAHHSWAYVAAKFSRRHQGLVLGSGVALLAIVAGLTASTILFFKEQAAHDYAEESRQSVEIREKQLRGALSRADFAAAQRLKEEGDYSTAVASLMRALRSDPNLAVAGADLQTLLAYTDQVLPITAPLPLPQNMGAVARGSVSGDGHTIAILLKPKQSTEQHLLLCKERDEQWQTQELPTKRPITHLALSTPGNLLATVEARQELTLRALDKEGAARSWHSPEQITALLLEGRNTQRALIGLADGSVWSVTLNSDEEPQQVFKAEAAIRHLAIMNPPVNFVAGTADGEVWMGPTDLRNNRGPFRFFKLPSSITALALSTGGHQVAAADASGFVTYSDVDQPRVNPVQRLHEGSITTLALDNAASVITAGSGMSMRWTNLETGAALSQTQESAGNVERILFSRNSEEALIITADASLRLWRQDSGPPLTLRKPQQARLISSNAGGRSVAVTRDNGKALEVYSLAPRRVIPLHLHPGGPADRGSPRPRMVSFVGTKDTLVVSAGDSSAHLWDTTQASLIKSQQWPKPALALAAQKDGRVLAALTDGSLIETDTSNDNTTTLLAADLADILTPLDTLPRWEIAAISPDGEAAVWCEHSANTPVETEVRVYDRRRNSVRTLRVSRVSSAAINAEADVLALGMRNGVVRIEKLSNLGNASYYSPHLSSISTIALSRDGSQLLTGSTDGTLAIWDTFSGAPRMDYLRAGAPVLEAVLSGNGQRFAAATSHNVFVGDIEMQCILGPRLPVPFLTEGLSLNHNGTKLAIAGGSGSTVIYPFAPSIAFPPDWFANMTSILVSKRYTRNGIFETTVHPGLPALLKTMPAELQGPWGIYAEWVLSPPDLDRTVSPWTQLTVDQYLQALNSRPGDVAAREKRRLRPALLNSLSASANKADPP